MAEETIKTDTPAKKELAEYLKNLQEASPDKRIIKYEVSGDIIRLGIEAHKKLNNKNGKH